MSGVAEALERFGFSGELVRTADAALRTVGPAWTERERKGMAISAKLVKLFADAGLTEAHLCGTTGYGYHDAARDAYESLLAQALDAESALARLQLVSGTHAIVACIQALLGPRGRLCSLSGTPYDTLRWALVEPLAGASGNGPPRYCEAGLLPDGAVDRQASIASLRSHPAVVFVQRSRGYAPRAALSVAAIGELVALCREHSPDSTIVVDNCYGEFVEASEPCAVGADIVVGSLIKNPGGGLAPAGAYIAGREAVVSQVADRIFAPGLGRKVGPTLDASRWLFAGLHRAARAVTESLKVLDFAAALFALLGYHVSPAAGEARYDIIQSIRLGDAKQLTAFAEGMQRMLPVNARARPEPGEVPGYRDPVIMAAGSFIGGSTMELSCDAPLREPYEVYIQGGMDVTHGVVALLEAASAVLRQAASRHGRIV